MIPQHTDFTVVPAVQSTEPPAEVGCPSLALPGCALTSFGGPQFTVPRSLMQELQTEGLRLGPGA